MWPRNPCGAWRGAFMVLVASVGLMVSAEKCMAESKRIVYIEASTVNRWKLEGFSARTGRDRYRLEPVHEYAFDKSVAVKQALGVVGQNPDAIILQECSVYFPGDLETYKRQYRAWILQVRSHGVQPVIATVVPPGAPEGIVDIGKAFVKERLLGRPSRYQQVVQFNEWLRGLGKELDVAVFDLEEILRKSTEDRHMRDEYDAGDGVHVNGAAYTLLDREFGAFLDQLKWQSIQGTK